MKKTIFALFVMLTLFSLTTSAAVEAATLHTILVGDTKDETLGSAFMATVGKMLDEATLIAKETGLSLSEYVFVEEDAIVDNVLGTIKNLDVKSDDVVLVYFAIHGYRNLDKINPWPSLYFGFENRGLDFHFVNKALLKKKPRLLLSIADSCNNSLTFNFPTVEKMSTAIPYTAQFMRANYKRLFLEQRGSVIVASAQPGQYSWAYVAIGGLWTIEFLKTFKKTIQTSTNPDWNTIMSTVDKNVVDLRIQQKGAIQNALYEVNVEAVEP